MKDFGELIKEHNEYIIFALTSMAFLALLLIYIYKKTLKRINSVNDLPKTEKKITLRGRVIKTGDGDGLYFYHIPFLSGAEYKQGDKFLKIRLAGVDAPEATSGKFEGQPFSVNAAEYLKDMVLNKMVTLEIYKIDAYGRIVAGVFLRKGLFFYDNISVKMVEAGLAVVYVGQNAQYGNFEGKLLKAQEEAQNSKTGMWCLGPDLVSPSTYKSNKRHGNAKE